MPRERIHSHLVGRKIAISGTNRSSPSDEVARSLSYSLAGRQSRASHERITLCRRYRILLSHLHQLSPQKNGIRGVCKRPIFPSTPIHLIRVRGDLLRLLFMLKMQRSLSRCASDDFVFIFFPPFLGVPQSCSFHRPSVRPAAAAVRPSVVPRVV